MNLTTLEEIDEQDMPNYANSIFTKIGSNIIDDTGFVADTCFFL